MVEDLSEGRKKLNSNEIKETLENEAYYVFDMMCKLAMDLYTSAFTPNEINEQLIGIATGTYQWLKDIVEKSGHSMSEISESHKTKDKEKYNKIITDTEEVLKQEMEKGGE